MVVSLLTRVLTHAANTSAVCEVLFVNSKLLYTLRIIKVGILRLIWVDHEKEPEKGRTSAAFAKYIMMTFFFKTKAEK